LWGRFGTKLVFEIWASWVLWFWRWTFGIVGFVVLIVNCKFDNKEFQQCGQLWQWGPTTYFRATQLHVEFCRKFLYQDFDYLSSHSQPNGLHFQIVGRWGWFFNTLDHDLTLWEAFFLFC
jgi:hypothetical protein